MVCFTAAPWLPYIASGCGGYHGEDVDRERTGPLFNTDHMESLCHHPGQGEFRVMQCYSVLVLTHLLHQISSPLLEWNYAYAVQLTLLRQGSFIWDAMENNWASLRVLNAADLCWNRWFLWICICFKGQRWIVQVVYMCKTYRIAGLFRGRKFSRVAGICVFCE